jgi:hypothetical protein
LRREGHDFLQRKRGVALFGALERNRSNIGFYSYRKFNLSVVVE